MGSTLFRDPHARSSALAAPQPRAFGSLNRVDPLDSVIYRVPCYDWKSFLALRSKIVPSITKYHHFKVSRDHLGIVELQEFTHSSMEKVDIQKPGVSISVQEMPEDIPPPGIPTERRGKNISTNKYECSVSPSMQILHALNLNQTNNLPQPDHEVDCY